MQVKISFQKGINLLNGSLKANVACRNSKIANLYKRLETIHVGHEINCIPFQVTAYYLFYAIALGIVFQKNLNLVNCIHFQISPYYLSYSIALVSIPDTFKFIKEVKQNLCNVL